MQQQERIVLIHAVPMAIAPVLDAFRQLWPAAECVNVLDDSLGSDRGRSGELTAPMAGRIEALARYGQDIGAHGILFTCSAFGEAIESAAAKSAIPVLKPNEAMFEEALERGHRVGMLVTFEPCIASLEREFHAMGKAFAVAPRIETICVPEAMVALRNGDATRHDELLAQAAPRLAHCEVILLGQFSTARAAPAVREVFDGQVLASPLSAVAKLRSICQAGKG